MLATFTSEDIFIGNPYYYPETGRYDQPDSLMTDTASMKRFVRTLSYGLLKGLFTYRPLGEHTLFKEKALTILKKTL